MHPVAHSFRASKSGSVTLQLCNSPCLRILVLLPIQILLTQVKRVTINKCIHTAISWTHSVCHLPLQFSKKDSTVNESLATALRCQRKQMINWKNGLLGKLRVIMLKFQSWFILFLNLPATQMHGVFYLLFVVPLGHEGRQTCTCESPDIQSSLIFGLIKFSAL